MHACYGSLSFPAVIVVDFPTTSEPNSTSVANYRWLRQQIGYVEQTPMMFAGTVADNIRYGKPDATDEEVQRAATLAHVRPIALTCLSSH